MEDIEIKFRILVNLGNKNIMKFKLFVSRKYFYI